jgi:hypothetical protein
MQTGAPLSARRLHTRGTRDEQTRPGLMPPSVWKTNFPTFASSVMDSPGPLAKREGLMWERRGPGSVGSSGSTREMGFEVSEQERGREGAERARAHLARAESELEAAQRFVDPGGGGEAELALARALANARASVADAMETVRMTLGEQDARYDDGPLP